MQNIKLREGMALLNKVDGKVYVVTKVNKNGSAIATEGIVSDDGNMKYFPVENGKEVEVVPGKNDIAFRFLKDQLPHEVPEGYTVKDGILMLKGKPVTEQGEIVIDRIICCNPGNIILAVKPREEKAGYIDLFSYNLARDKFVKMIRATIPNVTHIGTYFDTDLLAYSMTHTEKEKVTVDGKEEEVEKEYFDASAVIAVSGRRVVSSVIPSYPFDQNTAKIIPTGEHGFGIFFETDKKIREEENEAGYDGDDGYDEEEFFVDDDAEVKAEVETMGKKVMKGVARVMMMPTPEGGSYAVMAPLTDEGEGEISYAPSFQVFVMNDGKTLVVNGTPMVKSPKTAEVAGMTLVDITEKDDLQIFTFADKEAKVIKKLVVKHTPDRGTVVTVE